MTRFSISTALSGGVLLAFAGVGAAQTPLPPIEVRAPKAFELGQIKVGERRLATPAKVAQPSAPAQNGGGAAASAPTSFDLDNAPTPKQNTDAFGGYTITNRQVETFARNTLDRAVNIAPGVNAYTTGGPRNEQNIYVRGFDRWQVPLTVDGVRVYLPVDNRLDFARFMTPDIAEAQIAKGYVSVLDGPGGMGGQINLVSRKASREIESEFRSRVEFGRDGTYQGTQNYGFVGTKKDFYYAQLSGAWQKFDGWVLPASFGTWMSNQGSGFRNQSYTQDYNINAKLGVTPNATDEYSLTFSRQEGAKGAPLNVYQPIAQQNYWKWPYWRVQNLYFLSKTQLGDASYVKTRGYWSKFENSLFSYDNPGYLLQSSGKSFDSYYSDYALGTDVEAGTQIGDIDTLKGLFFYRLDTHTEWQQNFGVNYQNNGKGCIATVPCSFEPVIASQEDTYSVAVENTLHPRKDVDIVGGFSYDWRHLRQAQGFVLPQGTITYTPKDMSAPNYQGAVIWRYNGNDSDRLYFNVSDRVRYPTLFERFSTRFGGATSNPGLLPERAANYDLGWSSQFAPNARITVDIFHSWVQNLIQSVPVPAFGLNVTQSQNVGAGRFSGAEVSVDYQPRDDFSLGGNLTVMRRRVYAPYIPTFQPIGVPDIKLFLYAGYRPIPELTLTPNIEMASSRWTVAPNTNAYYRTGAYFLTNFNADYQVTNNMKLTAGVRNLFDQLYFLTDGFPEPGRSMYVAVKATF
jgi:iron complex outermembrane receptor protein